MAWNSAEAGTWWVWAINGTDIQAWIGSFSVRMCRTRRPALVAKTTVPAIASTKASPTASVRRHVCPTIQYSWDSRRDPIRSTSLDGGGPHAVGGP